MIDKRRLPLRLALLLGVMVVIGLVFAAVDLRPNLHHLDVTLLTGPEEGNYHALGARFKERAAARGGRVHPVVTNGTIDNLERLVAARDDCQTEFALAQDGVPPPQGDLRLLARLPKSESLLFLGKDASRLQHFEQLRGLRLGIGPEKGGTDSLVRKLFEDTDFAALGVRLENHPLGEQVDLLSKGELELGAFVLDEDAALVREAVRDRGLELAAFEHVDVLARRYPFLTHGRIGAGQFDPVRMLPPEDRHVLRVDTLVVGNGCASHAEAVAMLSVLREEI